MRKVKLDLNPNANYKAALNQLRAKGLKAYRRRDDYNRPSSRYPDANWLKDLSSFIERAKPHPIITDEGVKVISLKLDTLEAIVDDYDEVIGWKYTED